MRSQATNEPFQEDLKDGSSDEAVEQAENSIVDIPEGANADLHEKEEEDRN